LHRQQFDCQYIGRRKCAVTVDVSIHASNARVTTLRASILRLCTTETSMQRSNRLHLGGQRRRAPVRMCEDGVPSTGNAIDKGRTVLHACAINGDHFNYACLDQCNTGVDYV
jgi:hypothetical protein